MRAESEPSSMLSAIEALEEQWYISQSEGAESQQTPTPSNSSRDSEYIPSSLPSGSPYPSQSTKRPLNSLESPETKRIKTPQPTMLFLGGGNLSFESAFCDRHHLRGDSVIATTYEPQSVLNGFRAFRASRRALLERNVMIRHGVDARTLHSQDWLKDRILTHVYFVHPFTDRHTTQKLLEDTFASLRQTTAVTPDTQVHIIRIRGGRYEEVKLRKNQDRPYEIDDTFHLNTMASYARTYGFYNLFQFSGFRLCAKRRVNLDSKYLTAYQHAVTKDLGRSAKVVGGHRSCDYVFQLHADRPSDESRYDSEGYDSEEDSNDYRAQLKL